MDKEKKKIEHLGVKRFAIIVILAVAVAIIGVFCLPKSDNKLEGNQPPIPPNRMTHLETINEVKWEVTYFTYTKKIESISATFEEIDRVSQYYQDLKFYYGDSTSYVKHNFTLNGKPCDDANWFTIEITEKAFDGWDHSRVFYNTTRRYEEKLIFNLPN